VECDPNNPITMRHQAGADNNTSQVQLGVRLVIVPKDTNDSADNALTVPDREAGD